MSHTEGSVGVGRDVDPCRTGVGKRDINDVDRDILLVPEDFEGRWQA